MTTLYNFDLSEYSRRDTSQLDEWRREKINTDLGYDQYRLLFLVGEEGFVDVQFAPFREYSLEELESQAIAIYIASAKKADKVTLAMDRIRRFQRDYEFAVKKQEEGDILWKNWTPEIYNERLREYTEDANEKLRTYLSTMVRVVEPQVIEEALNKVKVKVKYTEDYEACRIESEIEFIPDLYEIIVVLKEDNKLFHRPFIRNYEYYHRVIGRLQQEGRYSETYTVI